MSAQPIPEVFLRYIEGLKTHDVEKIAGTVSDDLRFISATRTLGKPDFVKMIAALYTGFPDWHYHHDPIEWDGAQLAVKWRQGGSRNGVFAVPGMEPGQPTGRKVVIPEHYFRYRLSGDKITVDDAAVVPGRAP